MRRFVRALPPLRGCGPEIARDVSRLSIREQVASYLLYYPGADADPLLELLSGKRGLDVAVDALAALSDGFSTQTCAAGEQVSTAVPRRSTASVLVEGGRLAMLRALVAAGAPAALHAQLMPGEATSKSAWLERLCSARMWSPDRGVFSQTSLFRLATTPLRHDALEVLEMALEYHPKHPDIDALANSLGPGPAAALNTALMRHRIGRDSTLAATPARRSLRAL